MQNNKTANGALLAIVFLSGMISALNTGTMYIAYPEFVARFQTNINTVQWLAIIYSLTSAMLTPTAGYFAKRYSLKNVFLFALALMLGGSLACMAANTIYTLILFRGLQGMAGGLLMPLSLATIYQFVPKAQQGQFLSINLMAMSLGPAIGPTLSGVMIDTIGWKGIFLCNIPIILINGYLAAKKLPEEPKQVIGKLDYWAMATVFSGTMLLLLSFNWAVIWGFRSAAFLSFALLGCGLIGCFIRRQLTSTIPLLNFHVFRSKKFILSVIISATLFCNITGGAFLLPYYLQNVVHFSSMQAGAILFLPAACMVVATPVGGWLYSRLSALPLLGIGLSVMALGTVRTAYFGFAPSLPTLLFWMSLRYIGAALANVPAMDYGLGDIPKQWSGHGSVMNNWIKSMATSIFLSMVTAFLSIWGREAAESYQNMGFALEKAALYGMADAIKWAFLGMSVSLVGMVVLCILSVKVRPIYEKWRKKNDGHRVNF